VTCGFTETGRSAGSPNLVDTEEVTSSTLVSPTIGMEKAQVTGRFLTLEPAFRAVGLRRSTSCGAPKSSCVHPHAPETSVQVRRVLQVSRPARLTDAPMGGEIWEKILIPRPG
jgi:hypothetical protein